MNSPDDTSADAGASIGAACAALAAHLQRASTSTGDRAALARRQDPPQSDQPRHHGRLG